MIVNTIEGKNMVKPINDSTQFSRIETDASRHKEAAPKVSTPETDSVNLSNASKQMTALRAMITDVSEVNQARIEFIKQVIKSGDYDINPSAIAKKMLSEVA